MTPRHRHRARGRHGRPIQVVATFVGVFVGLSLTRHWGGWSGFFAGMGVVFLCGLAAQGVAAAIVLFIHRRQEQRPPT